MAGIRKGSTVEVSINEAGFEGAWYVATIIDEIKTSPTRRKTKKLNKLGYLVRYHTLLSEGNVFQPLTEVVDRSFVRPLPPEGDGVFEVGDVVDANHRDGWWIGVVKSVINEIRKYVVLFDDPREEFTFDGCKLRLHVDWVDCCWMIPPKKKPEQELGDRNATNKHDTGSGFTTRSKAARITDVDASCGKNFQSSAGGSKGNIQVIVSDDIHQDSPPVEHEIIITQTHESEDGMSHQKRKRSPTKSVAKKLTGLLEGSSSLGPPDHHGNSPNQASFGTSINYQQDWPFIKRSPMWAIIELYSQKPHFAPLKEMNEDCREGLAIAHLVTFGNLVERLSDLKPNAPVDIINNSLEALCALETHGFDVGPIRGRLNQLLSLKTKMCQQDDKLKEVEKEIEMCNHEKSMVEKEMDELKVKMQVLQSKSEQIATMQKAKEEELMRLKTNDLELDFEKVAATPL